MLCVPSRGIEPLLQDPQSCVLSVERRGLVSYFNVSFSIAFKVNFPLVVFK